MKTTAAVHILLVEDDINLGFILQENLEIKGYRVSRCTDGEAALQCFQRHTFDLCLLDVMLPKLDGFSLARRIRRLNPAVPIIFLTAKSLKEDRIEGFQIGGDDYVTKPFSLEELLLRIRAVLKRTRSSRLAESPQSSRFEIGDYIFDVAGQTLRRGNKVQKLTSREAELLKLICLHGDEYLPREKALVELWGEDNYFNGRSMDVFISKLRKYLSAGGRVEIRNLHGKGFKLVIR